MHVRRMRISPVVVSFEWSVFYDMIIESLYDNGKTNCRG